MDEKYRRKKQRRDRAKNHWLSLVEDMKGKASSYCKRVGAIEDPKLREMVTIVSEALSNQDCAAFEVQFEDGKADVKISRIVVDPEVDEAITKVYGADSIDRAFDWIITLGHHEGWSMTYLLWAFGSVEIDPGLGIPKEKEVAGVSDGVVFSLTQSKLIGVPLDPEGDFADPRNIWPIS